MDIGLNRALVILASLVLFRCVVGIGAGYLGFIMLSLVPVVSTGGLIGPILVIYGLSAVVLTAIATTEPRRFLVAADLALGIAVILCFAVTSFLLPTGLAPGMYKLIYQLLIVAIPVLLSSIALRKFGSLAV